MKKNRRKLTKRNKSAIKNEKLSKGEIRMSNIELNKQLLNAIRQNDAKSCRDALTKGADLTCPIKDDGRVFSDALAYAAYRSDVDTFKSVLEAAPAVVIKNSHIIETKIRNGETTENALPLLHALSAHVYSDYESQNEKISALLDKGADVNKTDDKGLSAASYACYARNLTTLKLLTERGADLDAQYGSDKKKIINALFNFDGTYFDFDYQHHKKWQAPETSYDKPDPLNFGSGWKRETPKEEVISPESLKDKQLMEQRLKEISDVYTGKAFIKRDQMMPYHEKGVNINDVLMKAIKEDDLPKVAFALQHDADPFEKVKGEYSSVASSVEYAVKQNKIDVLDLMIENKVDMNRPVSVLGEGEYSNVLFLATEQCLRSSPDEEEPRKIFEKVLAATSDESLNASQKVPYSIDGKQEPVKLMHYAMSYVGSYDPVFRGIVERGYDVNSPDQPGCGQRGKSALEIAVDGNRLDDIKFMVEHGGNLDVPHSDNDKKLIDIVMDPERKENVIFKYRMHSRGVSGEEVTKYVENLWKDIQQIHNKQQGKQLNVQDMWALKKAQKEN